MIKEIKFDNETASKGRNGIIRTLGVEVMSSSLGVMLSPITGFGNVASSCFVEIDTEKVRETVIAMLEVKGIDPVEWARQIVYDAGFWRLIGFTNTQNPNNKSNHT